MTILCGPNRATAPPTSSLLELFLLFKLLLECHTSEIGALTEFPKYDLCRIALTVHLEVEFIVRQFFRLKVDVKPASQVNFIWL